MIKLVFADRSLAKLADAFHAEDLESAALMLARPVHIGAGNWRLLVQAIHVPSADDYEVRSKTAAGATARFRIPIEKQAHRDRLSLIYCHSHPKEPGIPRFSSIDDATEAPLARYARSRVPNVPHVSMLVGAQGCRARTLGGSDDVEILEVGRMLSRYSAGAGAPLSLVYDRQIRAFGEEGQRSLQDIWVAIVGLGGTGSLIAQQLAHLGVRRFLLIDPDKVDETSLNRLVGATRRDLKRAKVLVARRSILRMAPDAKVRTIVGNVLDKKVGKQLVDVGFVFCCTDNHGSRHFINQLAYQYYVPCIDMGVVIRVHEGQVTHIDGRVQMLAPGLSCLVCRAGILSPNEVRWDLSAETQRQTDPYFLGRVDIKQPAVISLNSTAASLAVTMFLGAVAGVPAHARSQVIRNVPGVVRVLDSEPYAGCVSCSSDGYLGKGDSCALPIRSL